MAELSCGGTLTGEITSRASTRPSASKMPTSSACATGSTRRARNSLTSCSGQGLRVIALQLGRDLRQRFHDCSSECSSASVLALKKARASSSGASNGTTTVLCCAGPGVDLAAAAMREPHQAFQQRRRAAGRTPAACAQTVVCRSVASGRAAAIAISASSRRQALRQPRHQVQRKQGRVAGHGDQVGRFAALQPGEEARPAARRSRPAHRATPARRMIRRRRGCGWR